MVPSPASTSARTSAPSFAAQPPHSVRSVRRSPGRAAGEPGRIAGAAAGSRGTRMGRIIRVRRYHPRMGAVGSRWAPRSSKPVRSRLTRPGGFDSHALPPPDFGSARRRSSAIIAGVIAPAAPRPPSVERLLAAVRASVGEREHVALVAAARDEIAAERARLVAGAAPRPLAAIADALVARLASLDSGGPPVRVLNATGVIVHTNLGRAPWPEAAIRAAEAATREPLFLELDPETGKRGRRYRRAEEHLVALTGAEDALVTNNCAAALVLAVGLAGRK